MFRRNRSDRAVGDGLATIGMMSIGEQRTDSEEFSFRQRRDEDSVIKVIYR